MGSARPSPEVPSTGRGVMAAAVLKLAGGGAADLHGDDTDLAHARRARLRAAQEAAADATWRAEQANAAANRGLAAVTAARAALEEHAGVGGKIAAFHAGLLRAGATEKRAALPADLAAARGATFAAEVDLEDAEATHDLLSVEAREAAGAAVEAGAKLRAAVDELVRAAMEGIMLTVRRAELEAGRARVELIAFANTRLFSDPPVSWPLSQLLMDRWHEAITEACGASHQAAGARWNQFRQNLLTDAGAELPG